MALTKPKNSDDWSFIVGREYDFEAKIFDQKVVARFIFEGVLFKRIGQGHSGPKWTLDQLEDAGWRLIGEVGCVTRKPIPPQGGSAMTQIDGDHYSKMKIQPIDFIEANGLSFSEGCVIKYICRWKSKGGVKDLEKAKTFIDRLIKSATSLSAQAQ